MEYDITDQYSRKLLFTDARFSGWGAHIGDVKSGGLWGNGNSLLTHKFFTTNVYEVRTKTYCKAYSEVEGAFIY